MQELLMYLALFGVWTWAGWFVIYVLRYGNVEISLTLLEHGPYKGVAMIATVLAVLLWPIAPVVTLIIGRCLLSYIKRKEKHSGKINKE